MDTPQSLSEMSEEHAFLIRLMQKVNYGRIEGLSVRNGQLVLDTPPRVIREIKFGSENGPRPESAARSFAVKAAVTHLLKHIGALRQATIHSLDVKGGLPFAMKVEEHAA